MASRIRACHIIAAELRKAAMKGGTGFVSRDKLIKRLLNSPYRDTAKKIFSGYMNDIRVYLQGELEIQTVEHSRFIKAYKLVNFEDFDEQGRNITLEKSNLSIGEIRRAYMEERQQQSAA